MSAAYSMAATLSPVPDIGEVPGKSSGDNEQGVDADVVAVSGKAGSKALRRNRYASEPIFVESPGGGFDCTALLDLDKGNNPAAPSDKVDFTTGDTGARCKDSPALQPQPPGGDRLRPATLRFGLPAI